MRGPTERDLINRMQARDESAVADLEAMYGSRIHQLAFRYLRNREDAEEITQDVLLKVYRKIEAFRGDAALSSWIYRITFNAAMSRLRGQKQDRLAETPTEWRDRLDPYVGKERWRAKEIADWSSMADDRMFRQELSRRLVAALKDLPAIYRVPILLRDIHGFSTEEASAVLRIKDQTLKSRLHRGRVILRDRLADFAGGLSLHQPDTAAKYGLGLAA